jgi:hypothetical protein
MLRILRTSTWWATVIGVGFAILGIAVLLAYAASEVLADPSLSLEDGYWIGRLPWTPIGVGLTIVGATIVVVAGATTVMVAGGRARRAVTLACLAVATFWWLTVSILPVAASGAWCGRPTCPQPTYDPITMAYSSPQLAVMWLLLPALVVAPMALMSSNRTG